jgi:RHS repeat-associated protein
MGAKNYYSVNQSLLGESGGGGRLDYLPDALGSNLATINQSGVAQNTYRYRPFGEVLSTTGGATDLRFQWNGESGYAVTALSYSEHYVRARHLSTSIALWTSVDPSYYRLREGFYIYVEQRPTLINDPTGLGTCADCCPDQLKKDMSTPCYSLNDKRGEWRSCDIVVSLLPGLKAKCTAQLAKPPQGYCEFLLKRLSNVVSVCNEWCKIQGIDPPQDDSQVDVHEAAKTSCCLMRNGFIKFCGQLCCFADGKTFLEEDPCIAECLVIHESGHKFTCTTPNQQHPPGAVKNPRAWEECRQWAKEAKCLKEKIESLKGCNIPKSLLADYTKCINGEFKTK